MDAARRNAPLGGLLDRSALADMLASLGDRLPEIHVRWDGVSMAVSHATALVNHRPANTRVVALLLLDGQRPALCLSTQ